MAHEKRRSDTVLAGVRSAGKRLVETLWLAGSWPFVRTLPGSGLILAYHNVVPDEVAGGGDASLHLSQSAFAAQLDRLVAACEIVPLPALFDHPAPATRPRVAITFDDAYQGAVTLALPELYRVGVPATVFVAPGLLGGGVPWWDRLANNGAAAWTSAIRERALTELHGDTAEVTAAFGLRPDSLLHKAFEIATEAELVKPSLMEKITVGSHTWSHRNLATLREEDIEEELADSFEWLRTRFATFIPWLAYPYGRGGRTAAEIARRIGYRGAVMVTGGWLRAGDQDIFAVPRLNVPAGLTPTGLRLRLRGVVGTSH